MSMTGTELLCDNTPSQATITFLVLLFTAMGALPGNFDPAAAAVVMKADYVSLPTRFRACMQPSPCGSAANDTVSARELVLGHQSALNPKV